MFKNILVAFDGSDLAEKALDMGKELSALTGAKLHIVHINLVAASLSVHARGSDSLQELLDTPGGKVRQQAEGLMEGAGVDYEIVVIDAPSPAKPINDYAMRNHIDLIVMGSRGLGTMKQYFGSVAHSLLNVTQIPTTIIKG